MTTAVAPNAPMTAEHRCDRCGAQAYIRVELSTGGELLFCAHHGREHDAKIREMAKHIQDETDKLDETPAVAPEGERGA